MACSRLHTRITIVFRQRLELNCLSHLHTRVRKRIWKRIWLATWDDMGTTYPLFQLLVLMQQRKGTSERAIADDE